MSFPRAEPHRRIAPPPSASLEARAAALDPAAVLSRRALLRLVPGSAPALAFLHLRPDDAALSAALGPLGDDLLRHVAEGVALRALDGLHDPTAGEAPAVLIDLPARAVATLERRGGPTPVAALPLCSAADPAAFAGLADMARRQGWGIALHGFGAHTLGWLRPRVLAADWFILAWSGALRDGAPLDGLRQLDPVRIILTGCDTAAALEWGLGQGIEVFGGSQLDAAPPVAGGSA